MINDVQYFVPPRISLLLPGDNKEAADDAHPAEHDDHDDQGKGETALGGRDVICVICLHLFKMGKYDNLTFR